MLTFLSFAAGLFFSGRAMKELLERYLQERKYRTIDPNLSAEEFLRRASVKQSPIL